MALVTSKSPVIVVSVVKGHNSLNQIQELCFNLGLMSNLVRGHTVPQGGSVFGDNSSNKSFPEKCISLLSHNSFQHQWLNAVSGHSSYS